MKARVLTCKNLSRRTFICGASCAAVDLAFGATGKKPAAGGKRPSVGAAKTIRVVHMGDPQFGFAPPIDSEASYAACKERFLKLVPRVNALKPDLVVIAGDMCNISKDMTKEWPDILRQFKVPVAVTPGNHDLEFHVLPDYLARFRKVFGCDRKVVSVKGWYFIIGNSQFWQTTKLVDEQAAYEKWLKERLAEAKAYGGHAVIATHVPPFVDSPDEAETYNNTPMAIRAKRLASYREAGVHFYLAGHTHAYKERKAGNLTVLNAETTCFNFDKRPFGFRLLTLKPDLSYTYEFMPLEGSGG